MTWKRQRKRHSTAARKGWSRRRTGRRTPNKIYDGDTFGVSRSIAGTRVIRIANYNSPEKGQRGYKSSKQRLSRLIKGKPVGLKVVAKDRYGRAVARVKLGRKYLF